MSLLHFTLTVITEFEPGVSLAFSCFLRQYSIQFAINLYKRLLLCLPVLLTEATSLQVPRDVTEETLRPLFEPWGDIEHINILRTHRGQSAGNPSTSHLSEVQLLWASLVLLRQMFCMCAHFAVFSLVS